MSTGLQIALILIQALLYIGISWRMVRAPRKYWERMHWRCRTRGACDHEPTESTLSGYRAMGVVVLVVTPLLIAVFANSFVHMAVDTSSARSAAVRAVQDLRSKEYFYGPTADDVRRAVHNANPFMRFRVVRDGQYEITNARGRGPVCLTIHFDLYHSSSGYRYLTTDDPGLETSAFDSRIDNVRC
jgi:hypothetical protein